MKGLPEITKAIPLDTTIKSRIAFYYFLQEDNAAKEWAFWHYPHFYSTLLFCQNSEIVVEGDTRYFLANQDWKYTSIYNHSVGKARREVLRGAYNMIGVVFRPLGDRYFLPENLQDINCLIQPIFETEGISERIKLLDEMFANLYQEPQTPILDLAINHIIASEGDVELEQLASMLKINRRTLLRNFKAHLHCTFREFKAVVKFRNALRQGVDTRDSAKLTEIAYYAGYYDQSDMIKNFRSKTNETPKKILKTITPVQDELLWKIA